MWKKGTHPSEEADTVTRFEASWTCWIADSSVKMCLFLRGLHLLLIDEVFPCVCEVIIQKKTCDCHFFLFMNHYWSAELPPLQTAIKTLWRLAPISSFVLHWFYESRAPLNSLGTLKLHRCWACYHEPRELSLPFRIKGCQHLPHYFFIYASNTPLFFSLSLSLLEWRCQKVSVSVIQWFFYSAP